MEISDHWIYDVLVGKLFGVPMQVYWAALFTIFSYYLYRKHVFGIHIHHVGDNPDSAAQMGINVNWVRISAFMYVGLGAALAGIFSCLINFTWWPTQGFGYLLLALAAVFIGGTPNMGRCRNDCRSCVWCWCYCIYGSWSCGDGNEWGMETIL